LRELKWRAAAGTASALKGFLLTNSDQGETSCS
jgi:hypothetical protein